ncbi:hypothetical protein PFISCL1PPCAC_14721, partial [Pristionchus fissidentatus]
LLCIRYFLPFFLRKLQGKKSILHEKKWKKDTVYLYQLPGTAKMSSISPFCIKVEAFLRLHKIDFERRYSVWTRGSNGKVPFIELNGEEIADSALITTRLADHFKIQEYDNLSDANIGHMIASTVDQRTF